MSRMNIDLTYFYEYAKKIIFYMLVVYILALILSYKFFNKDFISVLVAFIVSVFDNTILFYGIKKALQKKSVQLAFAVMQQTSFIRVVFMAVVVVILLKFTAIKAFWVLLVFLFSHVLLFVLFFLNMTLLK